MFAYSLLFLASGPVPTVPSSDFPKGQQAFAMTATVRIVNETKGTTGSGAIVGKRGPFVYILTANHVVEGADRLEVQTFTATTYPRQAGKYRSPRVVARRQDLDLALLRLLTRDKFPAALPVCPPRLTPTAPFPVVSVGCNNGEAPTCQVEDLKGEKRVRKGGKEGEAWYWELARAGTQGRSGGPLVDRRGYLVGIGSGSSNSKGYYVSVTEIHRFLEQHSFGWLNGAALGR